MSDMKNRYRAGLCAMGGAPGRPYGRAKRRYVTGQWITSKYFVLNNNRGVAKQDNGYANSTTKSKKKI